MAYIGQQVPIPLGQKGLRTDDVTTLLPPDTLTKATNIRLISNRIEKDTGSVKFNSSALSGAIVGLHDWFPTPALQRTIAVTSDGKTFRDTGDGSFTAGVAIDSSLGAPSTDIKLVDAGNEIAGATKKLFIFSNTSQVKFIDGDDTTLTTIGTPAADWSSAFPKFGIVFKNRLWAFGNSNNPHRLYGSDFDDHTDFVANFITFEVYPGEGDGLVSAFVYKGVMFLFKRPFGMYFLDIPDIGDETTWGVRKVDASFGIASPHSVLQMLDDLIAGNSTGSITSLKAVQAFGDIESGDVLASGQIEGFIRDLTDKAGISSMQSIYYAEKKIAMFNYRSKGGSTQDLILNIDVNRGTPRFSINNKDTPNVLTLREDSDGIKRPIYGDASGFVFLMDQESTFTVDGNAYVGEFQTPEIDFSFLDRSLGAKNKLFDFLTMVFVGTADLPVFVDVTIDGVFIETLEFNQLTGVGLDDFELDTDLLGSDEVEETRLPLHGFGKRITLRVFNTSTATFKIEQLIIGFRIGDEGEK